jgi:hypothetical protein
VPVQNLKTPIMMLLSCIAVWVAMKVGMHAMGYDEKVQEAAAIAQSLGDPAAGAELLAKEYEKSHPGEKLEFKSAPKPARTVGSFDESGDGGDFADDTRE